MKKILFISFSALMVFSGCKSKEGVASDTACNSCEEAFVRDYGDPSLDGCGWVIGVNSTIYKPENLSSDYHIDGLKVSIKYKVKEPVNCGMLKDALRGIYIEQIQKRNE